MGLTPKSAGCKSCLTFEHQYPPVPARPPIAPPVIATFELARVLILNLKREERLRRKSSKPLLLFVTNRCGPEITFPCRPYRPCRRALVSLFPLQEFRQSWPR